MRNICAKIPYYGLIAWVGLVATLSMLLTLFVEWGVVLGWITIFTTTIIFYTTTIEAEYVECEWASFITIPSGLVMMFAGVFPVSYFVAVAGPLLLVYGSLELFAPRFPRLAGWLRIKERRAAAAVRKEAKLQQLRQEQALFTLSNPDSSV